MEVLLKGVTNEYQPAKKINRDRQCRLWQNLDIVDALRQMVLGPLGA